MSVNTHRAKNIRLTIIDKYKDSISFSGRNFVLIFILDSLMVIMIRNVISALFWHWIT
jgi:hypothetical protein